jgi:hypothetical protein
MAVVSTQTIRKMSTRNLPGDKRQLERKAGNLYVLFEPIIQQMWEPRRPTTPGTSSAYYKENVVFFNCFIYMGSRNENAPL